METTFLSNNPLQVGFLSSFRNKNIQGKIQTALFESIPNNLSTIGGTPIWPVSFGGLS